MIWLIRGRSNPLGHLAAGQPRLQLVGSRRMACTGPQPGLTKITVLGVQSYPYGERLLQAAAAAAPLQLHSRFI